MKRLIIPVLLAAAPATALSQEDVIFLKDGRLLENLTIHPAEGGVSIQFENGDVYVPREHYLDVMFTSEEWQPTTEEEKAKFEKGLVPLDGKWVKPAKRDRTLKKRLEEKRAAIIELREHQLWRNRYKESTKHFDFEHTLAPEFFEYYRDLMEAYFSSFLKEWRLKQPKELGRLRVCFYHDRDTFHQVSGAGGGTLGYFRFVEPMELNVFHDPNAMWFTEEVMFHEANHYLQKLIDVGFAYPHFPGESLAEYYGASKYDPKSKKIESGLILEGRLTEIQDDIAAGKMVGLEELITTEGMYQHYNWGWSLVHFLMNDSRYAKKFQKFYVGLAKDSGVKREPMGFPGLKTMRQTEVFAVFKDYLGLKSAEDVAELETDWHAYVKEKLDFVTVHGMEAAGLSALTKDRPLRAQRFFKQAIEQGSTNATVYDKYAEMMSEDGKHAEAVSLWRTGLEHAPLNAPMRVKLAEQLMQKGVDHEERLEGVRLAKLAKEIDPENVRFRATSRERMKKIEAGEDVDDEPDAEAGEGAEAEPEGAEADAGANDGQ